MCTTPGTLHNNPLGLTAVAGFFVGNQMFMDFLPVLIFLASIGGLAILVFSIK